VSRGENSNVKSLNVIGAGRVGRALAWRWRERKTFAIQDVVARTPHGARSAVAFIGAGRAVEWIEEMHPADVWMLTVPDDKIVHVCEVLGEARLLRAGDVVFHCSGALPSSDLAAAAAQGALPASMHPLKSFADAEAAAHSFAGTYCAAEGAAGALALIKPAFEHAGAVVVEIDPAQKVIYHAASVLVCNCLAALMEAGLRCYEKSGLRRETATAMMEPLVRETMANVFRMGPVAALTGPIARGDASVIERQVTALSQSDPQIAAIYRALGAITVELARAQGKADAAALGRIAAGLAGTMRPDPKEA
jgi:predicted short-subunit dehydrogenase-like oxidoreductase (DUF2520 family)